MFTIFNNGTAFPCKICGASPRNSVHNKKSQFGYHPWIVKDYKCICNPDTIHDEVIHSEECQTFNEVQGNASAN